MKKTIHRPIFLTLTKLTSKNGSKISNKTTDPKYDRKASMEQARTHWHRKRLSKEACSTALRPAFNKWNHMKQTFFMAKEIISWEKHQVTEWEKNIDIQISNRPYLKYIKNKKLHSQKINNSIYIVCMNTKRIFQR